VTCPQCGSDHVVYLETARAWKCYSKHSKAKFSLKTGTILEDSPLGLDKWLTALWLIVNCKNGISSCEIARDLGITQKSVRVMAHRLRLALHHGSFDHFSGEVEVDETFIRGKAAGGNLRQRRALSPVPLSRRASLSVQQPQGHGRLRPLQVCRGADRWEAVDVETGYRDAGRG
jgi:transposase-like protein